MTLSEQSAALRRRLYDNRHWLPLLLYPAALLALLIARPFNIIPTPFVFTLLCAVISLGRGGARTDGRLPPRKSEEESKAASTARRSSPRACTRPSAIPLRWATCWPGTASSSAWA
ncbi:MAG: hypothetical protein ACLTZY_01215 [Alistipes indistinctus]